MIKKGDPVETTYGLKGEVVSICGWRDNKPTAITVKVDRPHYPITTVFVSDLKS